MDALLHAPIWVTALAIFSLRILDVSLGTIRTIAVVHGRIRASVALGFFEILIWVTAISSVITNLSESPLLLVAYAGGFATGNATGIMLERKLAWGTVLLRVLSVSAPDEIANVLRQGDLRTAVFEGHTASGRESLVFGTCAKQRLRGVLGEIRRLDPDAVYSVEPVLESSPAMNRQPLPHATGWRAAFLRK